MRVSSRRLHLLALRPDALRVHFDLGMRCWEVKDFYGVARHRAAIGLLPEGGMDCSEFLLLRWRELWLDDEQESLVSIEERKEQREAECCYSTVLMRLDGGITIIRFGWQRSIAVPASHHGCQ